MRETQDGSPVTHFFSLGAFGFGDASPRATPCSDRPSELPASASYDARPSSFRGIDFWVFVRWMMCYKGGLCVSFVPECSCFNKGNGAQQSHCIRASQGRAKTTP